MRNALFAGALLSAACSANTDRNQGAAAENASAETNIGDELIANPNGDGQVLRLEGNDSATFVDGELVAVNRAE